MYFKRKQLFDYLQCSAELDRLLFRYDRHAEVWCLKYLFQNLAHHLVFAAWIEKSQNSQIVRDKNVTSVPNIKLQ